MYCIVLWTEYKSRSVLGTIRTSRTYIGRGPTAPEVRKVRTRANELRPTHMSSSLLQAQPKISKAKV